MARPDFVTEEDITRWSEQLKSDPNLAEVFETLPEEIVSDDILETCYAGLWLCEELEKLECPESLIMRIQYTAGKLSYGHDVWEVHLQILEGYKNNQLEMADELAAETLN